MSRTYLYRATAPARPLASLVLAAVWCGILLAAVAGTTPALVGGGTLHGAAAGLYDRLFFILAAGALFVGLAVVIGELVAGRSLLRGLRLAGAAVMLVAGSIGGLDTARRLVRPGTPVGAADAVTTSDGELRQLARRRLVWAALGLVGAIAIVAGGVSAVRQWDSSA